MRKILTPLNPPPWPQHVVFVARQMISIFSKQKMKALPLCQRPLPARLSCAEQNDRMLRCARCYALYCSRACQKAHWTSGGHKNECEGIARARRDTDRDAQSRALARVSHMSGGAPADARCMFCLDWGDASDPIMRGCACRGSAGWTQWGSSSAVEEQNQSSFARMQIFVSRPSFLIVCALSVRAFDPKVAMDPATVQALRDVKSLFDVSQRCQMMGSKTLRNDLPRGPRVLSRPRPFAFRFVSGRLSALSAGKRPVQEKACAARSVLDI